MDHISNIFEKNVFFLHYLKRILLFEIDSLHVVVLNVCLYSY